MKAVALAAALGVWAVTALAADMVCAAIEATDSDHWYGVSFEKTIPELVARLATRDGAA